MKILHMQDSSKGKMYLTDERGHFETECFRSYNTFNSKNCQTKGKAAFGSLYTLNDETLAPGKSIEIITDLDCCIVLLPVVGALSYKSNDSIGFVKAGESIVFFSKKNECILLSNPFEDELVNYIQLRFNGHGIRATVPFISSFDIDIAKNELTNIIHKNVIASIPDLFAAICIGKFSGREEKIYNVSKKGNGLFIHVLQGAFEVQYRLLESRDSLALWNVTDVEIEALSNDAILLVTELPVDNVDCMIL
jgi:quercetin 2,3-dioxygenase